MPRPINREDRDSSRRRFGLGGPPPLTPPTKGPMQGAPTTAARTRGAKEPKTRSRPLLRLPVRAHQAPRPTRRPEQVQSRTTKTGPSAPTTKARGILQLERPQPNPLTEPAAGEQNPARATKPRPTTRRCRPARAHSGLTAGGPGVLEQAKRPSATRTRQHAGQ